MNIIYHQSSNCKDWNTKDYNSPELLETLENCPHCYARDSFVIDPLRIREHLAFDIYIPGDVEYNNISLDTDSIYLFPVQVQSFIATCQICEHDVKILPSFIVEGTILTYMALIFIALMYETQEVSWRKLERRLRGQGDHLSHSTLFKGVQRLGETLKDQTLLQKAFFKVFPAPHSKAGTGWPEEKSLKSHTLERERTNRTFLQPLKNILTHNKETLTQLFRRTLRTLLTYLNKSFSKLLPIYWSPWNDKGNTHFL